MNNGVIIVGVAAVAGYLYLRKATSGEPPPKTGGDDPTWKDPGSGKPPPVIVSPPVVTTQPPPYTPPVVVPPPITGRQWYCMTFTANYQYSQWSKPQPVANQNSCNGNYVGYFENGEWTGTLKCPPGYDCSQLAPNWGLPP